MTHSPDRLRALADAHRAEMQARRDAEALRVNEYSLSGPYVEVEWFGRYHVRIAVGKGARRRVARYWPATGRWRAGGSMDVRPGDFEDVRDWLEGGS